MNLTHDIIRENFDDITVQLAYLAMLDRNISSGDMEGLTLDEVKNCILPRQTVHRILVDGEVVGIFNPGVVDISCYFEWGLKRNFHYSRIGFIYIDEKHRNKGYATKILKEHVERCTKYAECCHEDNIASNTMLSKVLKFHKRFWNSYRRDYYNVYIKE